MQVFYGKRWNTFSEPVYDKLDHLVQSSRSSFKILQRN